MVGFRVVLRDADVVDVPAAMGYDVSDDGALVLRASGTEPLRLPAGAWVEVRELGLSVVQDVDALLNYLCVGLGFCLPPDEQTRLRAAPPPGIDAFTDAVLVAEGLDPLLVDKRLRRAVRACVARHSGSSPAGEPSGS
jgi:hypothetical protein